MIFFLLFYFAKRVYNVYAKKEKKKKKKIRSVYINSICNYHFSHRWFMLPFQVSGYFISIYSQLFLQSNWFVCLRFGLAKNDKLLTCSLEYSHKQSILGNSIAMTVCERQLKYLHVSFRFLFSFVGCLKPLTFFVVVDKYRLTSNAFLGQNNSEFGERIQILWWFRILSFALGVHLYIVSNWNVFFLLQRINTFKIVYRFFD